MLREYRQDLQRLRAEQARAQAAGGREEVERLEGEIKALELAVKGGEAAANTAKRAFSNVRLAIRAVMARLERGGPEDREFAEHLRKHLSLGYECLYTQPQGRIWD